MSLLAALNRPPVAQMDEQLDAEVDGSRGSSTWRKMQWHRPTAAEADYNSDGVEEEEEARALAHTPLHTAQ